MDDIEDIEDKLNNLKFGFRNCVIISCCYAIFATVNFYHSFLGTAIFGLCALSQVLSALKILRSDDV